MKTIAFAAAVVLLSSPAHAQDADGVRLQDRPAIGGVSADYRLGPSDIVDVRVVNRPQLSVDSVQIQEDGKIQLPMIDGSISAACRTEGELSRAISDYYREYLVNP